MLELYHGTTSVCAQKVRLTLAEKGLEWQSRLLELNGDHLTPEYLQINPNGVVPLVSMRVESEPALGSDTPNA
jgi:glutathione S-transferase